jgi:hypothetical protein
MDDAPHLSDVHRRRIGSPAPASLLVLVICGLGLAACARSSLDAFKLKPTTTTLLIQSNPAGADARSSLVPLHSGFDRLEPRDDQSSSGSCLGSTSSSMLRAVRGCLLMNPARSSVSTIW